MSTILTLFLVLLGAANDASDRLAPDLPSLDPSLTVVDTGKAMILLNQRNPAVAGNDSECLVVWCDSKSDGDIWGVRVSADGAGLSPEQVPVCRAPNQQALPAVARCDSLYLVVWQDKRSGTFDIYGARVALDGTVLDPDGFRVCAASNTQQYPTVAAGESTWLVVWEDQRTGVNVYGARVSHSGTVLDSAGLPIGLDNGTQSLPNAAWNGSVFLVVWKSDELGAWTTHGARVTPDGELLDPTGFFIAGERSSGYSAGHPAVASDGQDFCVVWQNEVVPTSIYATRVSANGVVVGEHTRVSFTSDLQELPAISYKDDRYFVAWQRYGNGTLWRDVWGARVSRDGVVLDSAGVLLVREQYDQSSPRLASSGMGWLVVWFDQRFTTNFYTIYGVSVDTAGNVAGEPGRLNPMQAQYAGQYWPAVAAGTNEYLLLWESVDPQSSYPWNSNICGVRLRADGTRLDSAAINLACHPFSENTPAVAHGDSRFAVVYGFYRSTAGGISAGLVTDSGQALNPYGIQITSAIGSAPDVAFGAGLFLAAWHADRYEDEIRAARVTETGVVLDPEGFIVSVSGATKRNPKVAFDGTNYLVVWEEAYYVKAARVGIDGTVIDPNGFLVANYQGRQPDVVFDGENYLVIWTDWDSYRGYGTRVTPSAQILDTAKVRLTWGTWENACREPEVAYDGENYVLVWTDDWSRAGIKGSLITTDLVVIDSFDVRPPTEMGLSSPTVACGPDGGILACSGRTQFGMPWDTLSRIWAAPLFLPVGVRERLAIPGVPGSYLAAYPTVFRTTTRIAVGSELAADAVEVYDAGGRLVRTLGAQSSSVWDGRDDSGEILPEGVYTLVLRVSGRTERRNVVKLR